MYTQVILHCHLKLWAEEPNPMPVSPFRDINFIYANLSCVLDCLRTAQQPLPAVMSVRQALVSSSGSQEYREERWNSLAVSSSHKLCPYSSETDLISRLSKWVILETYCVFHLTGTVSELYEQRCVQTLRTVYCQTMSSFNSEISREKSSGV
jgi:hypothetical protein